MRKFAAINPRLSKTDRGFSFWKSTISLPTEHDQMVRNYLSDIAAALKQYGQSKGYSLSDEYYLDMAWGGLDDPSDNSLFSRTYQNTADRERIRNRINAEKDNRYTNGESVKGKKACQ